MSYYQTASVANVDSLITTIKNLLVNSGSCSALEINTSSVNPPVYESTNTVNYKGREIIFKFNGTSSDPTKFYLSLNRFCGTSGYFGIGATLFSGVKNFDSPVTVTAVTRSAAGIVTVTCSSPHNLETGDKIIYNGCSNSYLNEGWKPSGVASANTFFTASVINTTIFTYKASRITAESGSGGYVLAVYNPSNDRTDNYTNSPYTNSITFTTDGSMKFFSYVDEHRIAALLVQGSGYLPFYIGETGREHIPYDYRGRAFLTSSVVSGNAVTITLDRSVSNIATGQKICFYNASGSSGTGSYERTTIINKLSNTQFTCNLSSSYPSGTLVGEDGMTAVFDCGNENTLGGFNVAAARDLNDANYRKREFLFYPDCTRENNAHSTSRTGMDIIINTILTEGSLDPEDTGYYIGQDIIFQRTSAPTGIRGKMVGYAAFSKDIQNDEDIMRVGSTPIDDDYRIFSGQEVVSPWVLAIGPGAKDDNT